GMSLSASHFPLLAALDRLGPLSVGEIAAALGVSQPGVTRLLEKLESDGLVKSQLAADRRRRPIMLSRAGQQLVLRGKQSAWARIEAAVAEACHDLRGSFLEQVGELEDTLEAASLTVRAPRKPSTGKRHAGA
ncbi:MAG TPA: MarR family transcriptional regulator, partial [Steroidobacteraceae bacterium]|nr:MarR family transcriptional regulator [Steroidobacteraceae bacterium]